MTKDESVRARLVYFSPAESLAVAVEDVSRNVKCTLPSELCFVVEHASLFSYEKG